MTRQVSRVKFGSILSSGCGAGADGMRRLVSQAMTARPSMMKPTVCRPVSPMMKAQPNMVPSSTEMKGAHLDQAVAAEQFVLLEMLRQDRVFDRAEEGRLHAGQEDAEKLQPDEIGEERKGRRAPSRRFRRI